MSKICQVGHFAHQRAYSVGQTWALRSFCQFCRSVWHYWPIYFWISWSKWPDPSWIVDSRKYFEGPLLSILHVGLRGPTGAMFFMLIQHVNTYIRVNITCSMWTITLMTWKLQLEQKVATWFHMTRWSYHISFAFLHWLPVCLRVQIKPLIFDLQWLKWLGIRESGHLLLHETTGLN